MKKISEKADSILKQAGLYRTQSRRVIMGLLLESDEPLSAKQIAGHLGKDAPDKVTIYRILSSLIEAGVVHKAYLDKRVGFYELADHCSDVQCHPHFTCTQCGRTYCLFDKTVPLIHPTEKGYVVTRQKLRLEGLCPHCS